MNWPFLISVACYPLAVYVIDFEHIKSISIDRLALFFSLLVFAINSSFNKFTLGEYILIGFYTVLSLSSMAAGAVFDTYLIMLLISITYYYSTISFLTAKSPIANLKYFVSAIYVNSWIIIGFSVYFVVVVMITGSIPDGLPFEDSIPFIIGRTESNHYLEAGGFSVGSFFRLALPFARPQDLGITCLINLIILAYTHSKINENTILFFMTQILLTIVIVMCGSKSIFYPLILYIVGAYHYKFDYKAKFYSACVALIIALLILTIDYTEVEGVVARLFEVSNSENVDAHIWVRYEALSIFLSDFNHIPFGYGANGFSRATGLSSAHSTFFTLLVDSGILGTSLFVIYFVWALLFVKGKRPLSHNYDITLIVVICFISNFLYYYIATISLWIGLAFAVGMRRNISRGIYEKDPFHNRSSP